MLYYVVYLRPEAPEIFLAMPDELNVIACFANDLGWRFPEATMYFIDPQKNSILHKTLSELAERI